MGKRDLTKKGKSSDSSSRTGESFVLFSLFCRVISRTVFRKKKKEKKQMSKRAPGSNLNQDNWDADEGPAAEQGTWNRAGESTLKSRVIMRAKRRGGGAGEAKQSAFGGLSAKLTAPPVTSGAFSFTTAKNDEKQDEKPETSQSTSSKTSDDEIKQLNAGVMKWIKLCLDNDPICDLRPVFEDYKKYIEKLDKLYDTKWVDAEIVPSSSSSIVNETKSPTPPPPAAALPTTTTTAPKSPVKKEEPVKPSFSASSSSSTATEAKKPPVFSFGGGGAAAAEKKDEVPKEAPKFSFSGSATTEKTDNKPSGGFFANLGGSKPGGGFSFGGAGPSSSSGFSFGGGATKPAEPTAGPSGSGGGDDDYVPPEAEKAEFDDASDALFHQKAKIFYMKDKNYKEIGVGQLFVKPLDNDKASLLVRADNTLGNILLNVTIPNAPAPSAMGKKDCMLSVIPNPPIDGVDGAVPLLIRVKTPDDRDQLLELIKSKQQN